MILAADSPLVTDWLSAGGAIFTTLIAFAALMFAWKQVGEAAKARKQARDLADETAQPYVVAYLEPSRTSGSIYDLVIKNFGSTGASSVTLRVAPQLQRSAQGGEPMDDVEVPDPIAFLAPGQEWRTFWDTGYSRERSGLPDRHEGVVGFNDSNGIRHTTNVVLDWQTMQRLWSEVKSVHDVAETLVEVRNELRKFTAIHGGYVDVHIWDGATEEAARAEARAARSAAAKARLDSLRSASNFPQPVSNAE